MTTQAKVENSAEELDRLISDYGPTKYQDIVRAMQWARHLRRLEEFRQVPMAELIERALLDIVGGKVNVAEIEKAVAEDQAQEERLAAKRSFDKPARESFDDKPAREKVKK
jgi:hypothetical protein